MKYDFKVTISDIKLRLTWDKPSMFDYFNVIFLNIGLTKEAACLLQEHQIKDFQMGIYSFYSLIQIQFNIFECISCGLSQNAQ